MADIKIRCTDCKRWFRFLGLPMGFNVNGAATEVGGVEGRFGIEPLTEEFQKKYEDAEAEIERLGLNGPKKIPGVH